jgi:hypothetical protein
MFLQTNRQIVTYVMSRQILISTNEIHLDRRFELLKNCVRTVLSIEVQIL